MTDLNKLREEFEQLPKIKNLIEECGVYFDEEFDCYFDLLDCEIAATFVNGSWYAYQKQQAKIDELQAKLDKAQKDSKRIDFLADKEQWIVNVQMPREIVERNLSSLRDAIDRAMDLVAHGEKQ